MAVRSASDSPPRLRLALLAAALAPLPPAATAWSPPVTRSPVTRPLSTYASLPPPSSSATGAVDERYYSPIWGDVFGDPPGTAPGTAGASARDRGAADGNAPAGGARITLTRWLSAKVQDFPELRDMESLHLSIQMACKTISSLVRSSTASSGRRHAGDDGRDRSMKRLDQISKGVLQNALRFTGRLRVVEAPRSTPGVSDEGGGPAAHQPGVTIAYALEHFGKESGPRREALEAGRVDPKWGRTRRLAACFDPLDGSGNADAAICTGTVFGVFDADAGFWRGESPDLRDAASLSRAVLQPGNRLLAAGYCLYSSTTMLVFTLGGGTHGFTLDQAIGEFVLTHPNMRIPARGNIYSCNEAYSEGWDDKFKNYLSALKTGRGETGRRYTQRYIGSMVGDIHRTLMYGGIFCYPPDSEVHRNGNLQLVYKSAPLAYILEKAGGRATNGKVDLLSVQPGHVHERSPCFMGSPEDMDELMGYLEDGNEVGGGNEPR